MLIVKKFGGTSVGNKERILNVTIAMCGVHCYLKCIQ